MPIATTMPSIMESFVVGVQGDGQGCCSKCDKGIFPGDLFAYSNEYHWMKYHLKCFSRWAKSPIDIDRDVKFCKVLNEAQLSAVHKRVESCNRQFAIKVPKICLRKAVTTECHSSRRVLLEVFVFLKPTEIDRLAASICKQWFHVTREEELWRRQYLAHFPPAAACSYRELMITKTLERCWHCGKQLALTEAAMICPLRGSWLCRHCSQDDECRIVQLTDYCKRRWISPKLVKFLDVPVIISAREKSIYIEDMRIRVTPYAQSRHKRLMEVLEADYSTEFTPALMQMIRSFDVEKVYELDGYVRFCHKPLVRFLGKVETEEKFSASIKQFVRRLMGGKG